MTKTSAAPGTYPDEQPGPIGQPTQQPGWVDPPEPPAANPTPPEVDTLTDIQWRAIAFAEALLANPRCDQLLHLSGLYTHELIGDALATACWDMAAAFTKRTTWIKQAATTPAQEPAQEPAQ